MALTSAETQRTVLYRFFGADDRLLYVGITDKPGQRWEAHMRSKPWWPKVMRQTAEWYPSRGAAVDAEIKAIRDEGPLYNKRYAESAGLDALMLKDAWTCAACGWGTHEPVEQIDHLEGEARRHSAKAPAVAEDLRREVENARKALHRLASSSAQALALLDQAMIDATRKPPSRPQRLTPDDTQKLLADLDQILGTARVRLAELPGMLRRHDPTWGPYKKLTGVILRSTLMAHGIRTTNTGNVPRLDPADLRQKVVSSR